MELDGEEGVEERVEEDEEEEDEEEEEEEDNRFSLSPRPSAPLVPTLLTKSVFPSMGRRLPYRGLGAGLGLESEVGLGFGSSELTPGVATAKDAVRAPLLLLALVAPPVLACPRPGPAVSEPFFWSSRY